MSQIKIPFKQWRIDDNFYVDGIQFVIVGVIKLPTDFIIRHLYNVEGAESSSELEEVFKDIFKNKSIPHWMYVHFFERVDKR